MDIHSHKCRTCAKVWTHDGDELQKLDKAGYDAGHTCCGKVQRYRYDEAMERSGLQSLMELLSELRDRDSAH